MAVAAEVFEVLDTKMIDAFPEEKGRNDVIQIRKHCPQCRRRWDISEKKLEHHKRKQEADPSWKLPFLCPVCRPNARCDVSGKKVFHSEEGANRFQQHAKDTYGNATQFPYHCEHCGLWHLTSKEPVQQTNSGTLASGLGLLAATHAAPSSETTEMAETTPKRRTGETRGATGETRELVRALVAKGKDRLAMAEELGVSLACVDYHQRKLQEEGNPKPKPSQPVSGISIGSLDDEEAALRAQLEAVQRKKQILIEAKRLKVDLINNNHSILIQKEGERMVLPFEERDRLIEMLMDLGAEVAA